MTPEEEAKDIIKRETPKKIPMLVSCTHCGKKRNVIEQRFCPDCFPGMYSKKKP